MTKEQLELMAKYNALVTQAWDVIKDNPISLAKHMAQSSLTEASMWGSNSIREVAAATPQATAERFSSESSLNGPVKGTLTGGGKASSMPGHGSGYEPLTNRVAPDWAKAARNRRRAPPARAPRATRRRPP